MTFFSKAGRLIECNTCNKVLRGYNFILKQHLKANHKSLWASYLCKLGKGMRENENLSGEPLMTHSRFLKCQVGYVSAEGVNLSLLLPESRMTREHISQDDLVVEEAFDGFKGRIQKEYNGDTCGPYMGPYDQSEEIPLKLQLSKSGLNFQSYTEFRHSDSECQSFFIN